MNGHVISETPSTLQEWASFLSVLNNNKNSEKPFFQQTNSATRIVTHLEKHFSKVQESQPIFRRLGKHTQLVLHFS